MRHQAGVPDLLAALIATVERLASMEGEEAATRLWKGEDGSLLAARLSELMLATEVLPPQPPAVLDGLLSAVLAQERVATRRGNNPQALHPARTYLGLV
nr:hypothetical protein [Acetobacter okinawensis]